MLDSIKRRRSIRKYTTQEVGDGQIRQLLEAAMAAPSGSNLQPWRFVVVRRPDLKAALAQTHPHAHMAAGSSVVIVVCGDKNVGPKHWVEDTSAATQNLLLQASDMGLGAVWVGCYPDDDRQNHVRRVLNIPDSLGVLCIIPIGYPAESLPARTQYDQSKVHYEVFQAGR